ncbi:MAG: gas vesicle protein GvpN [Devosia sp.]
MNAINAINMATTPALDTVNVDVAASSTFVSTPHIVQLTDRALMYLRAGYSIHLSGPAGTGKTTLAFHIAAQLRRPVTLMQGDHQLTSADLVGSASGYRKSKLVDNFIHSVLRTEETQTSLWTDNRLTTACRYGHTLIYDEFNRSPAEANTPLLSALSEGLLNLPQVHAGRENYLTVHPRFRVILTSNPEEYAGIYKSADALRDRVITIRLDHFDRDTEVCILATKAVLDEAHAAAIIDFVRALREKRADSQITVRGALALARVIATSSFAANADDPMFRMVCVDLFGVDDEDMKLFRPVLAQSSHPRPVRSKLMPVPAGEVIQ